MLGIVLVLSSIGVITAKRPVYASLSFLATLITLAVCYFELSAPFIALLQILVYAGAILVIFIFVIVLFQDAHQKIEMHEPKSFWLLLLSAGAAFVIAFTFFGQELITLVSSKKALPAGYGTVGSIGKSLYIDFFFPFEAVILLFLIAIVGALYIGKRGN